MDTTTITVVEIPLDQLRESPFNPRKTFTDIEQLAQDIRSIGRVLQPLLVRPHLVNVLHPNGPVDHYEVVFGHRRLRAATAAGLATVPCMVREMGAEETKRAQISENLSRKDVHAVEEAEGFQVLMRDHGVTADQLAEQIGKSKSYVYGRLKLLQALPEIREACVRGEIGSEVALLVARLRHEGLQKKALGYIKGKYIQLGDGGKDSFRRVKELLNEHFTLNLKTAIFSPDDPTLLPDAGTCTDCPRRASNAPEFEDIATAEAKPDWSKQNAGADVCTDPDCFAEKKTAFLKREAATLQKDGHTVVTGNAARAAVGADGVVKGAYIALKDVKKELRAIKGPKPETLLIQDPRTGEVTEAVRRTDAQQAGLHVAAKASQQDLYEARRREEAEEQAKKQAKADKINEQRLQLLRDVRDAMADTPLTEFDMRLIAAAALRGVGHQDKAALARLWRSENAAHLADRIPTMTLAEATHLARDCALVRGLVVLAHQVQRPEPAKTLQAAATHYGVTTATPTKSKAKPKKAAAKPEAEDGKPWPFPIETAAAGEASA
jgi:ParB/RepB/Spo0J family partition protein